MRRWLMLAVLPVAGCSASAQGDGAPASGTGGNRSFAVADFSGVALKGSDDVDIRVGGGFSVRAEGPADVLDQLKIVRDGDNLVVSRKSRNLADWGSSKGHAKVYVTMPRIAALSLGGSGNITLDRAEGKAFEAATGGSGDITIGAIRVESATVSIAGSGNIAISGEAQALSMAIAGSGDIDAGGVKARSADVSIAGSGSARATVAGPASVSILGSGDVDLGPDAQCKISKLGSGSVRCGK